MCDNWVNERSVRTERKSYRTSSSDFFPNFRSTLVQESIFSHYPNISFPVRRHVLEAGLLSSKMNACLYAGHRGMYLLTRELQGGILMFTHLWHTLIMAKMWPIKETENRHIVAKSPAL